MSIGLWVSVIFAVLIGGGGVLYAYIKGKIRNDYIISTRC